MKIGIRREDKNIWERRTPLTPEAVRQLGQREGYEILVQPSRIRIFDDLQYQSAGATISEDLSSCDMVLGVKEMPLNIFRPEGRYVFFSHTIKGQSHNMLMLKDLIDKKCTLIDYERIVDESGRRLVFFGRFAGLAGMIDTLYSLGKRLEAEGTNSVFSEFRMAHEYDTLEAAKTEFGRIAKLIREEGLPRNLPPIIFGFTGYGNVSLGAQELFDLLPHRVITPENLISTNGREVSPFEVGKVVFYEQHTVKPRNPDTSFDKQRFFSNPREYESAFSKYLEQLTVLVNCIYWAKGSPMLLTKAEAKRLWAEGAEPRLKVIGDISCDILGGIECTAKATHPDMPSYVYDSSSDRIIDGFEGHGPVIMAVDNLPCELSRESSEDFSNALMKLLQNLKDNQFKAGFSESQLPTPLKKAVILWKGEFTPEYQFMQEFLK